MDIVGKDFIVANVRQYLIRGVNLRRKQPDLFDPTNMSTIPLELSNLSPLIAATLLPFVPVALMIVPLDMILQQLVKLLL